MFYSTVTEVGTSFDVSSCRGNNRMRMNSAVKVLLKKCRNHEDKSIYPRNQIQGLYNSLVLFWDVRELDVELL